MSIGQIIRNRRKELGLTQDQLARRIDISKPYLSNIETGAVSNPPSDTVLANMERVLEIGAGELRHLAHLERTPSDIRQEHEDLSAEVRKLRGMFRQLIEHVPRSELGGWDMDGVAAMLGESPQPGPAIGQVVPIINSVANGYPRRFPNLAYPANIAEEYLRCPDVHDEHAFAVRVTGDSMAPRYHEGDIVIFSPSRQARGGDDCFVRFADDEGTTFKRFYLDEAGGEPLIRLQPLNSAHPAQSYAPEQITGLWPAVFRIERLAV
jgi:SOS-response transcriptional repressor LexA